METEHTGAELKSVPFYTILNQGRSGESGYWSDISVNAGHPVFLGHFPQMPVVPGVMMVKILTDLLQEITGTPLRLESARDIKFMSLIRPEKGQVLHIELTPQKVDEHWELQASVSEGETLCLKFRGRFLPGQTT